MWYCSFALSKMLAAYRAWMSGLLRRNRAHSFGAAEQFALTQRTVGLHLASNMRSVSQLHTSRLLPQNWRAARGGSFHMEAVIMWR